MLRIEGHRLYFDLVKHLTTLSTASMLLVAALSDKLFDRPRGMWLIAVAMVAFLLAIVCGLATMLATLSAVQAEAFDEDRRQLDPTAAMLSVLCFIIGYSVFLIFFLLNAAF